MTIRGVIFDKDGTLFDLQATWGPWTGRIIRTLAAGDEAAAARLGAVLDYDLAQGRLRPGSIVIAGTPEEVADAAMSALAPPPDRRQLVEQLNSAAMDAPQVAIAQLLPLIEGLVARGLVLGLVTNDGEAAARAHLRAAGIETRFHSVLGYDSGHGAKPDPAPLLAVAGLNGLVPDEMVMVGDSLRDLEAGRAAGMATIAVRSEFYDFAAQSALADAVLDDVTALPAWLDR